MKKRILSILLAFAMALSMVSPVFAATTEPMDEGDEGDIPIDFSAWAEEAELTIQPGGTATMQVGVTSMDEDMVTYRWSVCSLETEQYEEIDGAADSSLTVSFDDLFPEGSGYACLVTDYGGDEVTVYFTVYRDVGQFDAWSESHDVTVYPTRAATMRVNTQADYPYGVSYQWHQVDEDGYLVPVDGAVEDSLAVTFDEMDGDSRDYWCWVYYFGLKRNEIGFTVYRGTGDFSAWTEQSELAVEPGSSVLLQVYVNSEKLDGVTYEWSRVNVEGEWELVDGASGSSLSVDFDNTFPWDNEYSCHVTDFGGLSEETVYFRVYRENYGFEASAEEEYLPAYFGKSATMQVNVSSVHPEQVTYVWYWENADGEWELQEGVTGSTMEVSYDQVYENGNNYYCVVTDFDGVEERTVHFNISRDAYEFEAWADNGDLYIYPGETGTMEVIVTAHDLEQVTYQWYWWDGEPVPVDGAVGNSLTLAYGDLTQDYTEYCCLVTDYDGRYIDVYFNVNRQGNDFWIETETSEFQILPGDSVTMTVTPHGYDLSLVTYQWYAWNPLLDDGGGESGGEIKGVESGEEELDAHWELLEGADSDSLTVSDFSYTYNSYLCVVRDGYGARQTQWFGVDVQNNFRVWTDQEYYDITAGETADLTVNVEGSDLTGVTYSWYRESYDQEMGDWIRVPVEGVDGPTYTVGGPNTNGDIYCTVRDRFLNEETVHFNVYISNDLDAWAYDWHNSFYVEPFGSATLQVEYTCGYDAYLTFQWYRLVPVENENGSWSEEQPIEGATGQSYTLTDVDSYTEVFCRLDDGYGNTRDVWFYVRVDNRLSVSSVGDTNLDVAPHGSTELAVTVSALDTEGMTYQWYCDVYTPNQGWSGYEPVEGADGLSLTVTDLTQRRDYYVKVTDRFGNSSEVYFYLYVDNQLTAEAEGGGNVYVAPHADAVLTVTVSALDMEGITYQWYRDWTAIANANSNTYTVADVSSYLEYQCTVQDIYGGSRTVYFRVGVDNQFTAERVGSAEIALAPHGSAELAVTVSALDTEGLTCVWERQTENENGYWSSWETVEGADGFSLTASDVTGNADYRVRVADKYDNSQTIYFYIRLDNQFQAGRVGDYTTYVAPHGSAELQVSVSALATDRVTYQWYQRVRVDGEDGDWWYTYQAIEGATTDTYTVTDATAYTEFFCRVRDGYGSSEDVYFHVQVENHLTVTRVGDYEKYAAPHGSVTLAVNVTADDMEGLTYRWYCDGYGDLEDVDTDTYTISDLTGSNWYYVTVTDRYGGSRQVDFYVCVENELRAEPVGAANRTVTPGEDVTLQVSASALVTDRLTYQWYRRVRVNEGGDWWYDDQLIDGATTDTWTLTDVREYQQLYCYVDDGYGNGDSVTFSVGIENHLTVERVGDYQQSVAPHGSVTLAVNVTADDMTGMTYRWICDSSGVISGADSASYTLNDVIRGDYYTCTVTDRYGNEKTVNFRVTIDNDFHAEAVGEADRSVSPGEDVTLQVSASALDTDNLTYQWYRRVRVDGENGDWWYENQYIDGATSDTWTLSDVREYTELRCWVNDGYGNSTNIWFYIRIENHFAVERVGSYQQPVEPHGSVTLAVNVTADDMTGMTYRWTCDSSGVISGADSASYTLNDVIRREYYTCTVTDRYGNSQEIGFHVYVDNQFAVAAVGATERNLEPHSDTTLAVTVSALDMEGVTYQWYCDVYIPSQGWTGYEQVEGADGPSLPITDVTLRQDYYVYVTDRYGNSREIYFYLSVDNQFSVAGVGAPERTVTAGQDVTLQVTVSALDMEDMTFAWYRRVRVDGENGSWWYENRRIEGADGDTCLLTNVTEYQEVFCYVTDRYGNHDDVTFRVLIENHLSVERVGTYERDVAPGGSVTLAVNVTADDMTGMTYRWRCDRTGNISGADSASYTIASVTRADWYYCTVTDRYGNNKEIGFRVRVDNQFIVRPVGDTDRTVTPGSDVELAVTVSALDMEGVTYRWSKEIYIPGEGWSWQELPQFTGPAMTDTNVVWHTEYYVDVRDRYGNDVGIWFSITMDNGFSAAPVGSTQQDVAPGGSVTLAVTASAYDMEGLTYQWFSYDDNYGERIISGADTDSYTVENVTSFRRYYCRVMDKYGNQSNIWFRVGVDNDFTVERVGDESVGVPPHGETTLSVTVSAVDMTGITYRWYREIYEPGYGWTDNEPVANADGPSLTVTDVTQNLRYWVHVCDCYGNERDVDFHVYAENHLRLTAVGRTSLYVEPEEEITLAVEVTAADTQGLTLTWYDEDGYAVPGADGASLCVGCVTSNVRYRCTAADAYGNTATVWFYLYPASCLTVLPVSSTNPTVPYGTPLLLEVKATVRIGGLHYQWMDDAGSPIRGATGSHYIVPAVTKAETYRCVVTDDYGNSRTVSFWVKVDNGFYARIPEDQVLTADYGGSLTLRVEAGANDGQLTYYWYDERTGQETEGGSTYQVENIKDYTYVTCSVSDQYGNSTSLHYRIQLNGIGDEMQYVSGDYGAPVTLTVPLLAANANYLWRWSEDGSWDAGSNSTTVQESGSNTYTIPALEHFSYYRCTVTVDDIIVVEYYFEVSVNNGLTADAEETYLPVDRGETATLRVIASADSGALTYRWYDRYSGVEMPEVTGDTYVTPAVTGTRYYSCTVTDQYGNRQSVYFYVYLDNHLTVAPIQPYETREVTVTYYDGDYYEEYTELEYVVPAAFGGSADLSVAVSAMDTSSIEYEWYIQDDEYGGSNYMNWNRSEMILTDLDHNCHAYLYVYDGYFWAHTLRFAIEVEPPQAPVIATQPDDCICAPGGTAVFAVRAVGTGLTYQWQSYVNGKWVNNTVATARSSVMSFTASDAWNGRQYRCKITDAAGNQVISQTATLYTRQPLVITSQPADFAGIVNTTASFTVAATGEGLTYQWQYYKNNSWVNSAAANAKKPTLTLKITEALDGLQYRCVITDQYGETAISDAVTLTAIPMAEVAAQPDDVTGELNTVATFTVAGIGGELTYQWQTLADGEWIDCQFEGSTTDTLQVLITAELDGTQYRCVITDAAGNQIISDPATLHAVIPPIIITSQPADFTGLIGAAASFTVEAQGDGLTYQWQYKSLKNGNWYNASAAGSNTATMSIEVTAARDGMEFRCKITDAAGNTLISDPAALHVAEELGITGQPEDYSGPVGATASFTVTATGEGLTYQWQYLSAKDGKWYNTKTTGYDTATMSIEVTKARDGMEFRCKITDAYGNTVTSEPATLHMAADPVSITGQPEDYSGPVGAMASFTVTAVGDGLTYQWQYKSARDGKWYNTKTTGYDTATMSIEVTAARDGMEFRCKVTDAYGNTATSEPAALHMAADPVSITGQPEDYSGPVGA
ncbi:MAG: hypothetical protein IJL08_03905, partial [Oscillospiraceae bacterium]|nr:hypothetical protein [Oscillospiraceae bacterium]